MLHEMEIKVGVPYKGSGVLNNFGQWTFTPSQVGSREGQKSLVKQEENYTLYSTKKKVIIITGNKYTVNIASRLKSSDINNKRNKAPAKNVT